MKKLSWMFVIYLALCGMSAEATDVCGSYNTNTTWTLANSPYNVTCDVIFSKGTLSIEPGVTVKFATGTKLVIGQDIWEDAALSAIGTSSNPITFTSASATPSPGDWKGVSIEGFADSSSSRISYANISYAGASGNAALSSTDKSSTFDHLNITYSSAKGIYLYGGSSTIDNVTVSNCSSSGVQAVAGTAGTNVLSNSTITNNTGHGVAIFGGSINISNTTISNNTDYGIGITPGSALVGFSGSLSGNGGGSKNSIGYYGGQISRFTSEIWHNVGLDWNVLSSINVGEEIYAGGYLTIDPGIVVKFASGTGLSVLKGALSAVGTSANPITFTSAATTPAPGSWNGISFDPTGVSASYLSYANISYAGATNGAAVNINAAYGFIPPVINHLTISNSSSAGINVNGGSTTIDNVTVTNCSGGGIRVAPPGYYGPNDVTTLSNSTISNNTGNGVAIFGGKINITNTTINDNTDYAIGITAGSLLAGFTGSVSGNGSGLKNAIGYFGGQIMWGYSEIWHNVGLDWVILSPVTLGAFTYCCGYLNGYLTIEAGITAKFASGAKISVDRGALYAIGTATNPITFTSTSATPAPGDWAGITLEGGDPPPSQSTISYANINYAGGSGAIVSIISSPTLSHVTISNSQNAGFYIIGGAPTIDVVTISSSGTNGIIAAAGYGSGYGLTAIVRDSTLSNNAGSGLALIGGRVNVTNTTISNNTGYGISVTANSTPSTINNCTLSSNTAGGANNTYPSYVIDSKLIYWDASNGPSGTGTGSGQSVSTGIDFEPWLISAPSSPQFFNAATVSNRAFNPNNSSFIINFGTALSGNWSIAFSNSNNIVVRTITGSGSTAQVYWDGKNDGGVVQPNGTYSYKIQSTAGTDSATPAQGWTIVDSTLPIIISNVNVSPLYFSPNADTVQDTTTITATMNFVGVNWTVNVKNSSGAIVRSTTGQGSSISYTWDGKNSSGVIQPDGVYTLEIVAADGTTATSSVVLDNTLPTAILTSPAQNGVISNVYQNGSTNLNIIGTADDVNFLRWELYRGIGPSPTAWTYLGNGESPINALTFQTWATESLANGVYTTMLTVYDKAGNTSTTMNTFTLSNFSMSHNLVEYQCEFNPTTGGSITYISNIPFTVTQTIVIKNESGQVVRTLFSGQRSAGTYSDVWNGRNDSGSYLPDGAYFYSSVITEGASSMTWDLSNQPISGLPISNAPIFTAFDPFNNNPATSTWNLNLPAYVILVLTQGVGHIGDCNPPHYCAINWKLRESGPYTVTWAGVDNTGAFRPDLIASLLFGTQNGISKNVVAVYGTKPVITGSLVTVNPPYFSPGLGNQTVNFTFSTFENQNANVTIQFLNQSSLSVLRTINLTGVTPGTKSISWDGRADNGMWVAPGSYTVTLTITDSIGNVVSSQILTTIAY